MDYINLTMSEIDVPKLMSFKDLRDLVDGALRFIDEGKPDQAIRIGKHVNEIATLKGGMNQINHDLYLEYLWLEEQYGELMAKLGRPVLIGDTETISYD